jgi:two-component sensor histidine kinase
MIPDEFTPDDISNSPGSAVSFNGRLQSSEVVNRLSRPAPLRRIGLWLTFWTAAALLFFANKYLDDLTRQRTGTLFARLVEEATGVYAAAVLLPLVIRLARRYRLDRWQGPATIAIHMLAVAVFSLAHTSLNWASRALIFSLFGQGRYNYGLMPIRYSMEAFTDIVIYGITISFVYLFDHYKQSRDREVLTAHLETRLAEARLQTLAIQLQPHFLFNTLNMISEMVYESPEAADQMIARLSEMLRLTLRENGSHLVPLARELQVLQLYIEIMKGRFQERLTIQIDVEPDAGKALVPSLMLQPIVENSIRHAVDPLTGRVGIKISCNIDGDRLVLRVEDDGPGLAGSFLVSEDGGIGLSNTIKRLRQLYGEAGRLSLETGPGGGLLVKIDLPYTASASEAAHMPATTTEHPDDDVHYKEKAQNTYPDSRRRASGAPQDQEVSRTRT